MCEELADIIGFQANTHIHVLNVLLLACRCTAICGFISNVQNDSESVKKSVDFVVEGVRSRARPKRTWMEHWSIVNGED